MRCKLCNKKNTRLYEIKLCGFCVANEYNEKKAVRRFQDDMIEDIKFQLTFENDENFPEESFEEVSALIRSMDREEISFVNNKCEKMRKYYSVAGVKRDEDECLTEYILGCMRVINGEAAHPLEPVDKLFKADESLENNMGFNGIIGDLYK